MTESVTKISSKIENLASTLLATLDEVLFFSELSKGLNDVIKADDIHVFLASEDLSSRLLLTNGKKVKKELILKKGEGISGYVMRTQRPYFSNAVSRDPLFADGRHEGIHSELAFPIIHDGVIIGSMHFQGKSENINFNDDHLILIQDMINHLDRPIANLKMYLAAKSLNDSLMKKIEEKEKELLEKEKGLELADTFKINEEKIIGKSKVTSELLEMADRIAANNDVSVLLVGDAGVGKEIIARRIHCRSERKDHAFVSLDCSAMTEAQLEKELFGEEIVDFSRGHHIVQGLIETANNGTILLDHINHLSIRLQTRIFQFIKDGMAFRMNGQVPVRSNIRIISTTQKDIRALVDEGKFREDLHYCISTASLKVPTLKERIEDVELLATHFLNNNRSAQDHKSLSPRALKALLGYDWRGNIRELQNVMERAYILSESIIVEERHLPDLTRCEEAMDEVEEVEQINFSEMTLDELEKRHICLTLEHLGGNKTKTAKALGITVKTLYNKLHSYGMIQSKGA